jgi:hypothetical protein
LEFSPLIERELARGRHGRKSPKNLGDFEGGVRGEAAEIVAEKIGVSDELIRQALWLRENAPEEELEKLRL